MAGTQSIGALIVELRANSAQFSAEMDRARKGFQGVSTHAALSSRQMSRFAAIAAEQVVPGLRGSRQAVEGFVQVLISARGALSSVAGAAAVLGAGIAGFALGNVIQNFRDAQKAGFGYVESLKMAVGATKSYEEATKDALEEQKKFSAEQQKSRDTVNSLAKELATLRGDQETLLKIEEQARRARVQTLPGGERERAQALADEAALEQRRAKALERENKLLEVIKDQREERAKEATVGSAGATALGLTGGLILGTQEIEKFKADVSAVALEIKNLSQAGVPARDVFNEVAAAQGKVDEKIAELKTKFADIPALFNQIVEVERQIGAGGFAKTLDSNVRSIQKLGEGAAGVQDEVVGMAEALNAVPNAAAAAAQSMVIVTGNVNDLARAVANARFELGLLIGQQANVAVAAPGNF
jgi:hypothetical protein